MPGKMIGMSVGDKGPSTGAPRIEPEIDLRQVQAAFVSYFDQIDRKLGEKLKNWNPETLKNHWTGGL